MSLRGRYVIDRMKRVLSQSTSLVLPCPPYSSPDYWEAAYQQLGPDDAYEWGNTELDDLWPSYTYKPITLSHSTEAQTLHDYRPFVQDLGGNNRTTLSTTTSGLATDSPSTFITSNLASAMKVWPKDYSGDGDEHHLIKSKQSNQQQAILMLGCGNSRLGEDMILKGKWDGPIIQVDVSNRVIESMSIRCSSLIESGDMNFIQDDAAELTAFRDNIVDTCFDKGLIDAIYCAEDYTVIHQIIHQVHRVLKPGSTFCFLSFSRPEFLLPRLFDASTLRGRPRRQHRGRGGGGGRVRSSSIPWKSLEVQELSSILLYRLEKSSDDIDTVNQYDRTGQQESATESSQNVTRVRPVRLRRRDARRDK